MRRLAVIAAVVTAAFFSRGAVAQVGPGGPGPTPSPWTINGATISYSLGGIMAPSSVTGGTLGVGTINVSAGYYIGGQSIFASPSFTGTIGTLGVISLDTVSSCTGPANTLQWQPGVGFQCAVVTAAASSISVGTTDVANGTSGNVLYNNGGILGELTTSGAGSVVLTSGATLNAPNLGTPSAVTLTNGTDLPISTGVSGLGSGVASALGNNIGTSGAVIIYGGALGTPSSGTLTNLVGLPIATGVSGLGLNVASALAIDVGSVGSVITNGGALGTPSSAYLPYATGLPISSGVAGLGGGVAGALANNVGSSGAFVVYGGALGQPSSADLTNAVNLPLSTGVTGTLLCANFPALTGDVTTTSGACGATISNGSVTNAKLATGRPAGSYIGNPSGSTGPAQDFSTSTVTAAASVDPNNDAILVTDGATGALKAATPGQIAAAATAGVQSIGGTTGAISLGSGLQMSGQTLQGAVRGYLWGLTWSTAGASSTFSVTAGEATDSTGAALISIPAMSKTTSAWSAGNNGGALDTGTIAASTTYHVFVVGCGSSSDILVSLSPTAPTLPSGCTTFRRVASSLTDASSHWVKVIQLGDDFLLNQTFAAVQFFSSTTAPQAPTVGVPTGVQFIAKLSVVMSSVSPGTDGRAYLYSLDKSSEANGYSNINAGVNNVAGLQGLGMMEIRTNTAGQIGFVLNNASGQISIGLHGWRDDRGRSY